MEISIENNFWVGFKQSDNKEWYNLRFSGDDGNSVLIKSISKKYLKELKSDIDKCLK